MMNFAALDLNLLKVFDAVMSELNTTRAGERIGLSQPAVSSALARLRRLTGDQLFVRDGNKMVPTSLALEMRDPVRAAMERLEEVFSDVAGFDLTATERVFTINGSDFFSTMLMPELASMVNRQAPNATLRMLHVPSEQIVEQLSAGTFDMAVDRTVETPNWIASRTLFIGSLVCVAAKGHPTLAKHGIAPGARIPAEVFCSIPQAILSMDGSRVGTLDAALKRQGLARQVALTLPHFHAVALSVASKDIIACLPVHFAARVSQYLPIEIFALPIESPRMEVKLYWHLRADRDRGNAWLRELVAKALDLNTRYPDPLANAQARA